MKNNITGEFVLPNKWYVTVTIRNREVLSKWRFDTYDEAPSWFTVGAVVGYCKDSDSKEWDEKVNDNWENEITFQQFKKYVLKENQNTKTTKNMKAFKIIGSEPLLEAISKELLKLGYKWVNRRLSLDETSSPLYIASKDQKMWAGYATTMGNYTTFSLPKEYDEALAFAKSLLKESDTPNKKFIPKKGDYIYHNHGYYGWITIFSEFRNGKIIGEHSLPSKGGKNFYLTYRNSNDDSELRRATPEEKRWLDACIKEGKFVSKEEALRPKHKLSNCVHGKVYWNNNSYYPKGLIWRFDETEGECYAKTLSMIHSNLATFGTGLEFNHAHWENLREATSEEIAWLEACEKANCFIPKEEALETKEEKLLKEARKRYPIGTRIIPFNLDIMMGNPENVMITKDDFHFYGSFCDEIWVGTERWSSIVYRDGQWAEIVDEKAILLEEAKRRYPIGTKFSCLVVGGVYEIDEDVTFQLEGSQIYSYRNGGVFHKHFNGKEWAKVIPEVKKWDVGGYIVYIKGDYGYKPYVGQVMEITETCSYDDTIKTKEHKWCCTRREEKGEIKWFATKEEAEEFAKTLITPVYKEGDYVCVISNKPFENKKVGDVFQIIRVSICGSTVYLYFAECASVTSDRVRMATKDEIDAYKASLTYKFGNTIVTIDKANRTAKCEYGTVTFGEIEKVVQEISRVEKSKILGFSCSIPSLKIGCQTGTYDELMSIYNALKNK